MRTGAGPGAALLVPNCGIERRTDDVSSLKSAITTPPGQPDQRRSTTPSAGAGAFKLHCGTISAKRYSCLGVKTIRPSWVVHCVCSTAVEMRAALGIQTPVVESNPPVARHGGQA